MHKPKHFWEWFCSLLLCFLCVILSGCWDRQEMEERHFVLAAGIDLADEGLTPGQKTEDTRNETFVQPNGKKRYRLSLQILDLKPGSQNSGDTDTKQSGKTKTFVISNTGESLFEMDRDMLGQVNKNLWWEHMQTLIISEAVVKEVGLKPIFDWFLRDHEMRWRIKVLITPGETRSLLEYQPNTGEPGGIFFANILRNHPKAIQIAGAKADLGFASQALDNNSDIFIPRIDLKNDGAKITGAALFKKDKFAGYIDDYAVMGIKFIKGTEKSALITIKPPDYPNNIVVFEVFRHDTRLKPHVVDGNIYFTLDISMIGNIAEIQLPTEKLDLSDSQNIRQLEILFAEEVKQAVLYAWQTAQTKKIDFLLAGVALQEHEPAVWEQIKDSWPDEIFPNTPLIVSVNVTIHGIGEHK